MDGPFPDRFRLGALSAPKPNSGVSHLFPLGKYGGCYDELVTFATPRPSHHYHLLPAASLSVASLLHDQPGHFTQNHSPRRWGLHKTTYVGIARKGRGHVSNLRPHSPNYWTHGDKSYASARSNSGELSVSWVVTVPAFAILAELPHPRP